MDAPKDPCRFLKRRFLNTVPPLYYKDLARLDSDDDDEDDSDDDGKAKEPNEGKEGKITRNQRKKFAAKKLRATVSAIEEEDSKVMMIARKENVHNEESINGGEGEEFPPVPCCDEAVPARRKQDRRPKTKFLTEHTSCTEGCCNPNSSVNLFE